MSAEKANMRDSNLFNLFTPDKKTGCINLFLCSDDKENKSENKRQHSNLDRSPFFLYHSPSSLEKYIESFDRRKIRLVKEISIEPTHCDTFNPSLGITSGDHSLSLKTPIKRFKLETTNSMLVKRERTDSEVLNSPVFLRKWEIDTQSTLFSTSKKHRRLRKTKTQIEILQEYLNSNGTDWSKELVKEVSRRCNMKQSVVYKWIWDQKNKN
jgi:hypothetical protein